MSGLKHLGVGLGWVWLGDGSKPEADQVITVAIGACRGHMRMQCVETGERGNWKTFGHSVLQFYFNKVGYVYQVFW